MLRSRARRAATVLGSARRWKEVNPKGVTGGTLPLQAYHAHYSPAGPPNRASRTPSATGFAQVEGAEWGLGTLGWGAYRNFFFLLQRSRASAPSTAPEEPVARRVFQVLANCKVQSETGK